MEQTVNVGGQQFHLAHLVARWWSNFLDGLILVAGSVLVTVILKRAV